MQSEKPQVDWR